MKETKIRIFGGFCIILVFILMMIISLFCSIFPKVLQKLNLSNEYIDELFDIENASYKEIDFSKMYPIKDSVEEKNIIDEYKIIINKIKTKLEDYTSKKIVGYEKLIEVSYIYNDLISFSLVSNFSNNARIKIEDGIYSRINNKKNVKECADRLIDLKLYLEKLNIDLLYVQAPNKISSTQKLSSIYKDYTNENTDNFLNYLSGKIDYLDLRKNIEKSGKDNLDLFFKTDHHWLPETGLWATGEISNYLNNNYNMNLVNDNIDCNKFNFKQYSNMYLGSDGRYVSLKNAKPETFTLITPKFNTKLKVNILDRNVSKTDTFENVLIDWSKIQYKNYYRISQYSAYVYGDRPLIEIQNQLINNNKKILLIRDSFCNVVAPFLSLENEYLSVIDLRYFNGSIKSYINKFNPDIVIVMYYGKILIDLNNVEEGDEELVSLWNFE